MALYLEQYLDSLQGLPSELRRNLNLLKEFDSKSQQNLSQIDKKVKGYVRMGRQMSQEARQKKYDEILNLFGDTKTLGDDKVALAGQTYEMVDKHIRRLDADLARFETEIKRRLLGGKLSSPDKDEQPGTSKKGRKTPAGRKTILEKGKKRKLMEQMSTPGRKKKKVEDEKTPAQTIGSLEAEHLANLSGTALLQQLAGGGADVMDMPVDPNEPTYCLCHQVSYGEMVGCDNSDCPIEWFHFGCVNLAAKPKGKWYCPRCTEERKKKN